MANWIELLLATAPAGESPYAYVANKMMQVLPEKARWFFWMLGFGSIVNFMNLALNLVCIYMIGARRKLGETNPYWIVRLRYDHSSGVPYLVPNAIMAFLVLNGIFALLMQPYIWINYVSYMDQTRAAGLRSGLFFWYGFIFVFDGSGMWISAFGTFYATLLPQLLISNKISNSRFFVHPIFLNTLCYGLPAALFITQVITSALSQIAWRNMTFLTLTIQQNLLALDHQWSTNNKIVDSGLLDDTLALADPMIGKILQSRYAFVRNAITCGAWYLLCFLFFTPSATWLLYILRRTVTHKLQFVTRMPTSGVDIQLPVPMERFSESNSHVEGAESPKFPRREMWRTSGHQTWGSESRKPVPPVALHLPPSSVSLTGPEPGSGSESETPTSAVFLAGGVGSGSGVVCPAGRVAGLEHGRMASLEHGRVASWEHARGMTSLEQAVSPTSLEHGMGGGLDHSQRPHDPGGAGGGGPWELNVTSTSAKATRKLQTAYYSAMLQFAATAFCLAVASASWIWAASDERVILDASLHATAIIMTVWIYPFIGIIVNVFICIRLRVIGSNSNSGPKPRSKLMSYLQEVWASSSRSARS